MINVYFRTVDENGETGYFGYASAKDGVDLFWLIDEFIDPNIVQICKANGGAGFVTKTKVDKESGYRCFKRKSEFSNGAYDVLRSEKWFTPQIVGSTLLFLGAKNVADEIDIDYREILKKYMKRIIDAEGISFVNSYERNQELSEFEIEVLRKIEIELDEEIKNG